MNITLIAEIFSYLKYLVCVYRPYTRIYNVYVYIYIKAEGSQLVATD